MAYHAKMGFFFMRLPGGTVRMHKENEMGDTQFQVEFDPGTWASIVAQMSAPGETFDTFKMALELHDGVRSPSDREQDGQMGRPVA